MNKMVDLNKDYEALKKKRLTYSLTMSAILLICLVGCYLLIKYSSEKYILNLIGCVILSVIALFSLTFYLINIYSVLNKRISFYSSLNEGEVETSVISLVSIEEEIENDKHLHLYPLNVEVFDNLDKDEKVIFSFLKEVPFKEGKKYRVKTYQRIIIAWETIK